MRRWQFFLYLALCSSLLGEKKFIESDNQIFKLQIPNGWSVAESEKAREVCLIKNDNKLQLSSTVNGYGINVLKVLPGDLRQAGLSRLTEVKDQVLKNDSGRSFRVLSSSLNNQVVYEIFFEHGRSIYEINLRIDRPEKLKGILNAVVLKDAEEFLAEAQKGNSNTQYNYAQKNLEENKWETAFKWFRKSAENGNVKALLRVAYYYQHGVPDKLKRDMKEAGKWYDLAADSDNADVLYHISWSYHREHFMKGPEFNHYRDKKIKLMGRAAAKGHKKAQLNFAQFYVDVDPVRAKELIFKFAKEENELVQYQLGVMLFDGRRNELLRKVLKVSLIKKKDCSGLGKLPLTDMSKLKSYLKKGIE